MSDLSANSSRSSGWHFSVALFLGALGLYAVFGSPTPDHYGWAEFLIGGLLLLSVRPPDWQEDGFLVLACGVCVFSGLIVSFINGYDPVDIFRDLVPFLFIFLIIPLRISSERCGEWLVYAVVLIGVVFSVRALIPVWGQIVTLSPFTLGAPPDLLYLANSPEVLFSCLWLSGSGLSLFFMRKKRIGLVLLMLAVLPALSMVMMMQRAGVAAIFLVCLIWLYRIWRVSGVQFIKAILLFLVVLIPFSGWMTDLVEALLWKTHIVGLNSRQQEWEKVLGLVSRDWSSILFGLGWGARLENPAVGDISVLFTHSLFSAILLKTGVFGVGLTIAALVFMLRKNLSRVYGMPVLFWALVFPFLISAGIYASYKSLGFGLILLIFCSNPHQKLEKNRFSVA